MIATIVTLDIFYRLASSDFDNSVMITGVNEFNNGRRRGATMRMNMEGVELVSVRVIM